MDHLRYLCLVFVMLSSRFIAAVWSTVGKELTKLLLLYSPRPLVCRGSGRTIPLSHLTNYNFFINKNQCIIN